MSQPNKWELYHKQFLKHQKRYNELLKEKRRLPKRKLEEPFQDGWNVYLELNEEDLKSKNGCYMASALEACTKEWLTRDGKKISNTRKNRKFSHCRKYFQYKNWRGELCYAGPSLVSLKVNEWNELQPGVQKYFDRVEKNTVSRWGGQTHREVRYVCNIADRDLVVKIKKNIVTELRGMDPDLEREVDWLNFQMAEYWRHCPGSNGARGYRKDLPSYLRKHFKTALKKVKKGESEDALSDHHVSKHRYE